jgi:lipoate-protein ligase A
MHLIDYSLPTPQENLAFDEALLERCTQDQIPRLRFWEPPGVFVVLGYANRAATEVDLGACRARGIPVLRRISGGGTVLQAPGVLNYTLTFPISQHGPMATITGTNRHILERHGEALSRLLDRPVERRGQTDLALEGRKVSGNAQKRAGRALLFHGTFLLALPFDLLDPLLPMPSRQPDYRADRTHRAFLENLPLEPQAVKRALATLWQATPQIHSVERDEIDRLLKRRYANPAWNFRR